MTPRKIRLSVAVLAISIMVLAASAGDVQAYDNIRPRCRSGRCIRALGVAIGYENGVAAAGVTDGPDFVNNAVMMLDLWYRYVEFDAGFVQILIEDLEIHYAWFTIMFMGSEDFDGLAVSKIDGYGVDGRVRVGLPGGAIVHFSSILDDLHSEGIYVSIDGMNVDFYGAASYYTRRDPPLPGF